MKWWKCTLYEKNLNGELTKEIGRSNVQSLNLDCARFVATNQFSRTVHTYREFPHQYEIVVVKR